MKRNSIILGFSISILMGSCGFANHEKEEISKTAESFALSYYNMDFEEASSFCTEDTHPWIEFRASNITSADLKVYRESPENISVSIQQVDLTSDSTAFAVCEVAPYFNTDILEQQGKFEQSATVKIPFVKREGKWLVRMEGPLQNAE